MTEERWNRVRTLFAEAAELAAADREAFLRARAGDDTELASEVRALLEADEAAGDFLEDGPIAGAAFTQPVGPNHWLGHRFGAYEVVGELGRGGMGTVLLGKRVDGRYRGQVAIKLLRLDGSQGELRERFRIEGQILADLDHENIARLLDAGNTEDGHSYLIMEYVDGPRIDDYADQKLMGVAERLRLFRAVLDGAECAHAQGIVHRDLKPSNILVTAEGRPKIVDFGIAKLLSSDGAAGVTVDTTRTAHRMMTPEYASPEQVRGEAVDASSDVYSLGIVLYRLLTGRPPYQLQTTRPGETERVICEQVPPRPSDAVRTTPPTSTPRANDSTGDEPDPARLASVRSSTVDRLRRSLRGDLDTIILTALNKDPKQRYPSAGAFAADLDRHSRGQAIRAKSPSVFYRARRFAGRNRIAMTIAGSMLAGAGALAWQASVADTERELARQSSTALAGLAESLLSNLDEMRDSTQIPTVARAAAVTATVRSLDDIVQRMGGDPDGALLMTLGRGYGEAGAVYGHPFGPNLGRRDEAITSYTAAIALFERVERAAPATPGVHTELASARLLLSDVLTSAGRSTEASDLVQLARPVLDSLSGANPDDIELLEWSALASVRSAMVASAAGDAAATIGHYERAIELLRRPSTDRLSSETRLRFALRVAGFSSSLGDALQQAGRFDEAVVAAEAAVRLADSVSTAGALPRNAATFPSDMYFQLGWQLIRAGRLAEAAAVFTRQLEILEPLGRADPGNAQIPLSEGLAFEGRGQSYIKAGEWALALADLRTAIEVLERQSEAAPAITSMMVAQAHREAGEALTGLGRFSEAEVDLRIGLEQGRRYASQNPVGPFGPMVVALASRSFATLHETRARETRSFAADCPEAEAMSASADTIVSSLRTDGAMTPGLEAIWNDFLERADPVSCAAWRSRSR